MIITEKSWKTAWSCVKHEILTDTHKYPLKLTTQTKHSSKSAHQSEPNHSMSWHTSVAEEEEVKVEEEVRSAERDRRESSLLRFQSSDRPRTDGVKVERRLETYAPRRSLVLAHWAPTGCPATATIDTSPQPIPLHYKPAFFCLCENNGGAIVLFFYSICTCGVEHCRRF